MKRSLNRETWTTEIRKKKRNNGKSYCARSGVVKKCRLMKGGCKENCYLKCSKNFPHATREAIFKDFWLLENLDRKRDYIKNHLVFDEKKTVTIKTANISRRTLTYKYFLPSSKSPIRVCKKMFLETLDINDQWIKTILNKLKETNVITTDLRGILSCKNAVPEEIKYAIRNHINSFPRIPSHYCREKTVREYLEGDLNIAKMYRLYVEKMRKDGIEKFATKRQYTDLLNEEFNLGFFMPKKDQCETCYLYNIETDNQKKYGMEKGMGSHLRNKDMCRIQKKLDKKNALENQENCCFCFDMQKVLCTPFSEVGIFYYKRKLCTYNFTCFDLAKAEGYCYVWNETVAGRGSNEISSCLYHYITEKVGNDQNNFVLWADNCGGQNKNRTVLSCLMYIATKYNISLTLRFFEKGHTQNENDSIHATIERQKKNKTIYTPEQWYMLIKTAKQEGKMYKVKEMSQDDFFNFKNFLNHGNWNGNLKIKWSTIKEVFIDKSNSYVLNIKCNSFESTAVQYRMMENILTFPSLHKAYSARLPISVNKYNDLNSLCNSGNIPRAYHDFYKHLSHSNKTSTNYDDCSCDQESNETSALLISTEASTSDSLPSTSVSNKIAEKRQSKRKPKPRKKYI